MHWYSKYAFGKHFSAADCKVKTFCLKEIWNKDTTGIPPFYSQLAFHFPLWNKQQWIWQDFLENFFISMQLQSPTLPENGLMNIFHPV